MTSDWFYTHETKCTDSSKVYLLKKHRTVKKLEVLAKYLLSDLMIHYVLMEYS